MNSHYIDRCGTAGSTVAAALSAGAGKLLFVVAAVLLGLTAAHAGPLDRLEQVLVSRQGDTTSIEVRFACEHRYLDHSPLTEADQAQVTLRPMDSCNLDSPLRSARESRRPAGRQLAALSELEYLVRDEQGALLLLSFDTPVRVAVRQRGDLRSLFITLPTPATSLNRNASSALPGSVVVPDIEAPPVRSQQQLQRADEAARRRVDRAAQATAGALPLLAINLRSARDEADLVPQSPVPVPDALQLYRTSVDLDGQTWYRLRLGFFDTEAEATTALQQLRASFPRAWVVGVTPEEYALGIAATTAAVPAAAAAAETAPPSAQSSAPTRARSLSDEQLAALMKEGESALMANELDSSIRIYTKVLQEPEHAYSAEALERLGLARERNAQKAHAVAEYRRYLMLYPGEPGAVRVSQRLNALTAISSAPRTALRTASDSSRASAWDFYGGLAQYYRRDTSTVGDNDSVLAQSSVLSDFDMVARRRGRRFDFGSRATLGNLYDLLPEDEGPGTGTRLYYGYLELVDQDWGLSARIGRQRLRSSGVLGRFDGAHFAYQWRPDVSFNLMWGFPVNSSGDSLNTDQDLLGMSVDLTQVFDLFDVNLFFNQQETEGVQDRQALGGELRYFDDQFSVIGMLDYDVSYGVLNSVMLLGNWRFDNLLTLNATLDMRKSPYLMTRNAMIGQQVENFSELLDIYTEDELRALAEDRASDVRTVTLGLGRPLFDRFQINADVTLSDFSGTPASGGVAEMPSMGAETYYSVYVTGSSLIRSGDTTIFGLRYTDGATATGTTVSVDSRYPLTDKLRINPRLRFTQRAFANDDTSQWIAAPSLRLFYNLARRYRLELDVGGQWSNQELQVGSLDFSSWFIYAGYRADF